MGRLSETSVRLNDSRDDELVMGRSSVTFVRKARAELMGSLWEGQVKP
jgi:hypothetical protein